MREAEPLGKTWTGLISRHWGEEKGMTLCEERCCNSMEVIKSWTKTNINGLEIHLYDLPGKTWISLISRLWGEERDDGSLAEMLQSDGGHHNTNAKKQPIDQE